MLLVSQGAGFTEWWEILLLQSYNTRLVVLSTSLLGVAAGVVGSFLLLRKRSLMGDALSHATLPGIGIAFAVLIALGGDGRSLPGLLLGATLSGILGMLTMLAIRNTTNLRDDVAMGLVLSVFFGAGVSILRMVQTLPGGSAAGLESFIYGKTASLILADFFLIGAVGWISVVICLLFRKEFTLLCFDEGFGASQGWPTKFLDVTLLSLVTAVTVIGLQAVGLILIIAFLIIPPATARFWTQRLEVMMGLSAFFGGLSGWCGASISALVPKLPAGAVIVLTSAVFFLGSMMFAPARGVVPRWLRHRKLKRKVNRQHLLRAAYELLEAEGEVDEQTFQKIVRNRPFSKAALLRKRTWKPSALQSILRREMDMGHVQQDAGESLRLSEEGFGEAARITRNHRLWETYLVTHAEIATSHVDRDADMVEHVLEAELVQQLEEELRRKEAWIESPHPMGETQKEAV
ncbi:MAG: metal ABC transporter permease [Verrucomicrobiota bacterium]